MLAEMVDKNPFFVHVCSQNFQHENMMLRDYLIGYEKLLMNKLTCKRIIHPLKIYIIHIHINQKWYYSEWDHSRVVLYYLYFSTLHLIQRQCYTLFKSL